MNAKRIRSGYEPAPFDPGLTQQFTGVLRRSINKDGRFQRSTGRFGFAYARAV